MINYGFGRKRDGDCLKGLNRDTTDLKVFGDPAVIGTRYFAHRGIQRYCYARLPPFCA
jgi:hypothetical protein